MARLVFKTSRAWQPHAWKVRFLRRSVEPAVRRECASRKRRRSPSHCTDGGVEFRSSRSGRENFATLSRLWGGLLSSYRFAIRGRWCPGSGSAHRAYLEHWRAPAPSRTTDAADKGASLGEVPPNSRWEQKPARVQGLRKASALVHREPWPGRPPRHLLRPGRGRELLLHEEESRLRLRKGQARRRARPSFPRREPRREARGARRASGQGQLPDRHAPQHEHPDLS